MKIGAVSVVKNEQELIALNLRYHLDVLGLDHYLVIDNGSADRTVEILHELKDERIVLRQTEPGAGFVQSTGFTVGAVELFREHHCDWVLPTDGDEFWVSLEGGSLREQLQAQDPELDAVVVRGYCFHPTARDPDDAVHPLLSLRYARQENQPRLLLHRLGERLRSLSVGAHWAELADDAPLKRIELPRPQLARFHYRYLSLDDHRRRILNQAEGNIIRLGREWLAGQTGYAPRILTWYRAIREGRFESMFREKFFLDEEQLEAKLAEGSFQQRDELLPIFARLLETGAADEQAGER